jgi:hypothetical protein
MWLCSTGPTKFPPGQRFSYCDGGYVILALLAERVSAGKIVSAVRPAEMVRPRSDVPAESMRYGARCTIPGRTPRTP